VQRIVWSEWDAIEFDRAGIWPVGAAEHFHQRAFASTILADQRVHLAWRHFEADAFQRARCSERFGNSAEPKSRDHRETTTTLSDTF
jgi:hypothetical protein